MTRSAGETARLRGRLTDLQERLRRTRASLRVLEEQVTYLAGLADEAETRRLVAQTPLADREWRDATRDHERHVRLRDETRATLDELQRERDDLLDRLLELGAERRGGG